MLVVGHAASLGGVSSVSLVAVNQAATASTSTILGCDDFTGTTGVSMSARAASGAVACANRVWLVHVGTWTIQANAAASSATVSAVATENTGTVDSSVQVVLASLNTGGRIGGVVLSHDGVSTYLAAVMIDGAPDRIELRTVITGVPTVVATVTPTFAATNTLVLARAGSSVTVSLNGTSVLTFTLSAAQLSSLGTGARAGLFGGNSSVRFDDFVVTAP